MHTIWARVSNGSATLSSFMMALLAAISLSTFVFTADPKGQVVIGSLNVQRVKVPRVRYSTKKQEIVTVNFNATADLTPLFNWNTKQLFLYLGVEYTNAQGVKNEVVLWDRIVRRKRDANIKVSAKNKYFLRDVGNSFKGATAANFTLKYNIMPYVGVLTYGEAARTSSVELPSRDTFAM